jgi:hypothetical protein
VGGCDRPFPGAVRAGGRDRALGVGVAAPHLGTAPLAHCLPGELVARGSFIVDP